MKYLTTKENYKEIPFEVFAPFVPKPDQTNFFLKLQNQNGCGL
jgi:hypothetical protein